MSCCGTDGGAPRLLLNLVNSFGTVVVTDEAGLGVGACPTVARDEELRPGRPVLRLEPRACAPRRVRRSRGIVNRKADDVRSQRLAAWSSDRLKR